MLADCPGDREAAAAKLERLRPFSGSADMDKPNGDHPGGPGTGLNPPVNPRTALTTRIRRRIKGCRAVGKKASCASYSVATGPTASDGGTGFSASQPLDAHIVRPCISTPESGAWRAMTVRAPIEPSSEQPVQRHAGGKMPPLRGTNRGKSQSLREDRFYDDGRFLL